MKLILHSLICAAGATVPVLILHGDPFIMLTNMLTIGFGCLTFEKWVHGP